MLDKIQNNSTEQTLANHSLSQINSIGVTNPYEKEYKNFFIDESVISNEAIEKYEHEQDIKKFSTILLNTDENEANSLVLNKILNGTINFSENDLFSNLSSNKNLIDDLEK